MGRTSKVRSSRTHSQPPGQHSDRGPRHDAQRKRARRARPAAGEFLARDETRIGKQTQDPASRRAGRDAKLLDWLAVPAVRTKQRERTPADPYAAREGSSLVQCDQRTSLGEVRSSMTDCLSQLEVKVDACARRRSAVSRSAGLCSPCNPRASPVPPSISERPPTATGMDITRHLSVATTKPRGQRFEYK